MALCKKKTEKLWLWRAYHPIARRTIAWILGRRDDATCQKLLNKIGAEGKTFVTDDWEGNHRLIPEDQLFTGKDLTVPIDADSDEAGRDSNLKPATQRSLPRIGAMMFRRGDLVKRAWVLGCEGREGWSGCEGRIGWRWVTAGVARPP